MSLRVNLAMSGAHERNDYEKAGLLALAFRAWLATCNSRFGRRFAIQPASVGIDLYEGTDGFVVDLNADPGFDKERRLRFDLTGAPPKVVDAKVHRSNRMGRSVEERVKVLPVLRGLADPIVSDPCFRKAYRAFIEGHDMDLIALEEACPDHGNACELAGKLLALSSVLDFQLAGPRTRKFQMVLPDFTPLPKR